MKVNFRIIFERTDDSRGIHILDQDVFPHTFVSNGYNDPAGWAKDEVWMIEWDELKEFVLKAGIDPDADDHVYELYGVMDLESYRCGSPMDPEEWDTSRELSEVNVKILNKDEIEQYVEPTPMEAK